MNAEPRFATPRNPDRRTLGEEVCDHLRALDQPPMPWQRDALYVAYELDEDATEAASSAAGIFQPRLWYRENRLTVPRQSGKTTKALGRHLHRMRKSREHGWAKRPLSFYMAQTGADAREKLVEEWIPALEDSPYDQEVRQYLRANGKEAIKFDNGGRITVKPPSRTGGHGGTPDLVDLDEAFAHRDATAEQGVRPGMITKVSPQLWVVSTAGTAESEYLWGKVDDGRARCESGAFGRVSYCEYSAPQDADPADRAVWAACMPALGFTQTLEAVEAEFDSMKVDEFRRAYLNQWTQSVQRIIPADAWVRCLYSSESLAQLIDPAALTPGDLWLGVDSSPGIGSGRIGTIAAGGWSREPGKVHGEVIDNAPGLSWVAERVGELTRKWNKIQGVYLDPTGPIGSVLPDIQEASLVPVTTINAASMAAACGRFHEAVLEGTFRHLGQAILDRAVDGAAKRTLLDAWAWARRTSAADVSPLVAVTLAHWATVTHPEGEQQIL